jgi:hypothetical protein
MYPREIRLRTRRASPVHTAVVLALTCALLCIAACRPGGRLEGAALAAWLPQRSDIAIAEGEIVWRTGDGTSYRITWGMPGRELGLEAPGVAVRVAWSLVDPDVTDPLARLAALCARAGADRAPPCDGLLRYDPLLRATVLDIGTAWWTADDVLRPATGDAAADKSEREHREARAALRDAIATIEGGIAASPLDAASRYVLADAVRALDTRDDAFERYPAPSFVRRMVRHGWLADVMGDDATTRALRDAVDRAERLLPVSRHASERTTVERLADAFGRTVMTSAGREATRYAVRLPDPAYMGPLPPLSLVVSGRARQDPLDPTFEIDRAGVYLRGLEVAAARRDGAGAFEDAPRFAPIVTDGDGGRAAFIDTWREHVAPFGDAAHDDVLVDALPPHVLVITPHGDVRALVTMHGHVVPARRGDAASHERFIAQAARALPDAAHLDLLGQYLYGYAHDSPSPVLPALLGTPDRLGDIHQTVVQTLDTETGGMYRGDCDDLSEVYQTIAERQGRLAHMIGLPEHAALAWAEQDGDAWQTYVLQTAPPLRLRGASAVESLLAAYRSFDPDAVLHEDQLEVLLRFAGENTRDSYRLGARIFWDPGYARTMLDIQADWHAHTFAPALRKVSALVAADQPAVSELIELASLYAQTGRYGIAGDILAQALARSTSPAQRVHLGSQLVETLYDAGRTSDAGATVLRLETEWLPALEDAGAPAVLARLALVDLLVDRERDPARGIAMLDALLADVQHADRWYAGSVERTRLEAYMSVAMQALHATAESKLAKDAAWKRLARAVGAWIETAAFARPKESVHILEVYAWLGRAREVRRGIEPYRARVLAAPPPRTASRAHADRAARDAAEDASWIGLSTYYWWSAMLDLIAWDRTSLDRRTALALAHRLRTARVQASALGLDHADTREHVVHSEIVSGIAGRDMARLRAALASVHASGDRAARNAAAVWVAELGLRIPREEMRAVLDVARETLPPKPFLTQIAWRAALAGAPEHALMALECAAAALPDDAAIAEDLALMQQLYPSRGAETNATHSPQAPEVAEH